jgi:hypothetical protein
MGEHNIIGPAGTTISLDGRYLNVRYRDTDIVQVAYMEIILDSGSSRSFVVQSRLNQVARQFGLSYNVRVRGLEWVVETPAASYPFQDGMRIYQSPGGLHEYTRYPTGTEPTP